MAAPNTRPVTPLSILSQRLHLLTQSIASLSIIPPEIKEEIAACQHLASSIDPYLERCTTPASAQLQSLEDKTRKHNWSLLHTEGTTNRFLEQEMLSGQVEGQVLKMIVSMIRPQLILDIGMFTGYSALAMAEALPDSGKVIALEVDPYTATFAADCFSASPHGSKIQIRQGAALESMAQLASTGVSFDLAFIDADKTEYWHYFERLLEGDLLRHNGFICIDNTLLQCEPLLDEKRRSPQGEAIANFNKKLFDDTRVEQVMLPLRDGFTIVRRL